MPTRSSRSLGAGVAAMVAGGTVVLAVGGQVWLPLAMVAAVSVLVGVLTWRRAAPPPPSRTAAPSTVPPPPQRAGLRVYPLQRPVRPVAVHGAGARYTLRIRSHSQLLLVTSPGSDVGPEPVHTPLTGHNLVVSVVADGGAAVVLHGFRAEVTARTALSASGMEIAHDRLPDLALSPDLVESIQGSVSGYRRLRVPDLEVAVDERPPAIRPAAGAADRPRFPVQVAAGAALDLVLAPVTDDLNQVHWRLHVDLECAGVRSAPSCELTLTAQTGIRTYRPHDTPLLSPVRDHFTDHWQPGGADQG